MEIYQICILQENFLILMSLKTLFYIKVNTFFILDMIKKNRLIYIIHFKIRKVLSY